MKKNSIGLCLVVGFLILTFSFLSIESFAAVTKEQCEGDLIKGIWKTDGNKCSCVSAKTSYTIEVIDTSKSCAELLCKADADHEPTGTWDATSKSCTCKTYEGDDIGRFWASKEVKYESTHECLFLDNACSASKGTWDESFRECTCTGLYYMNDIGFCSEMVQTDCVGNGATWSSTTGCTCDETLGYYFELGKCITAKARCEKDGVLNGQTISYAGLWDPTAEVGDDNYDSTKYTVGTCKCSTNYVEDGGVCKKAEDVCEASSGTWRVNDEGVGSCSCKSSKMLSDGKCVAIPESAEKALCEQDNAGIWSASSNTCECIHKDKIWNSSYGCIPNCGSGEVWDGKLCVDASDSTSTGKVKCSLEKNSKFNMFVLLGFLFPIVLALVFRKKFKKALTHRV